MASNQCLTTLLHAHLDAIPCPDPSKRLCRLFASQTIPKRQNQGVGFGALQPRATISLGVAHRPSKQPPTTSQI